MKLLPTIVEKILDTKTYHFSYDFYNNKINYYLYDYKKTFEGYTLEDFDNIETTGILTEDITYNLYYTNIVENPATGVKLDMVY